MNISRYLVTGSVSIAIHAVVLLADKEAKVFAMPVGSQSTSVSINFVTQPKPQVSAKQEAIAQQVAKQPTAPKKTHKANPKKSVVPQPQAKPKPIVKTAKISKQEPVKKDINKPVTNAETPTKLAKTKTDDNSVKIPPPAPSRSGASSQPPLVEQPTFVSRPVPPQYPRLARKRGIEGVAVYEIWLDTNGNQIKQVLISSSGTTLLDNSALNAIKQWKFSPHVVSGQKMAHRVQVPVRFKLEG
ncbi:energy transducer TonB [Vibrio aestuarianus]|uniref:Energy transducer TonB n=1 Tax=Vibrio aestuarianus TaxID=28171 RepID=A0A9X4ET06_9VIBR|nr:energy transducer TonB [Vibrio aestuarianus]NGZ66795.1 energy transducer TonB [Vibrio aestuarianus subsp. cardii]MDE1231444.1 energy transducer TonB [Vibrio aestuarianus]MDE1241839.1 energy transducer TonB [Vibrio aestuarianus]MDE1265257.1 energy transducer TonB [Vibrio aestuarianus]MDE1297410.1 energy transducer TonB [Vibrio aestuarianus]